MGEQRRRVYHDWPGNDVRLRTAASPSAPALLPGVHSRPPLARLRLCRTDFLLRRPLRGRPSLDGAAGHERPDSGPLRSLAGASGARCGARTLLGAVRDRNLAARLQRRLPVAHRLLRPRHHTSHCCTHRRRVPRRPPALRGGAGEWQEGDAEVERLHKLLPAAARAPLLRLQRLRREVRPPLSLGGHHYRPGARAALGAWRAV